MKVQKAIVLSILVLLHAVPAFSQIQIGGFVEYDNLTYFKHLGRERINGRNQGILQLELRHQVNEKADLFGALEFREDQADATRNRIYLDEVYLDLYLGSFDIRLGKQIYAWGRADGLNPTDNLTAWDFSDILDTDDEKIGVVSARVNYYFGDWTLEGVLVPSFTASLFPDISSRWWPEFPDRVSNPLFPDFVPPELSVDYQFASPLLPEDGTKSTQYALKLSGTTGGWDFSLNWFDGFDDLPGLDTTLAIDPSLSGVQITFKQQYHRRRAVGADFATTLGKLGLRGEVAYYLTEDWDGMNPAIDGPYLHAVIGVDYTFSNLFSDKDLFVLAQWSQEFQIPDRNTAYGIFDLNHVFRKSLITKADLGLGDFSKLTFEGVYNFALDGWWLRPGLEWSVTDGVKLLANLDLLGGPEDSFFGAYRDNRRAQVRVKYSF